MAIFSTRTLSFLAAAAAFCGSAAILRTQTTPRKPAPVIGKSPRYCNPLPIPASSKDGSPQGVGLGDVTVIQEGSDYYLFGTGGGAWVSKDFIDWTYKPVEMRGGRIPVAPHVAKYDGAFYMTGNSAPLYKAPTVLGPYEVAGQWTDEKGQPWTGEYKGKPWKGAFDPDIFVDDDNKPYLYYPGRSTSGIFVVPLDPKDPSRFLAAPKHLFGFKTEHVWERWGEFNEYPDIAWIEGPWMFKRNGTYYIEYSASGTQWLTYASGIYSGKSPMGPFTYSPRNPFLRKPNGIVTGPGHGCVVKGPDGNWWVFYTIVMANPSGGRRIGMDPVGFDAQGNPYVREVTETPQWAPGVVANPARDGASGSIPLSTNKLRAMHQEGGFSSQRPGHDATFAVDGVNGGWWEPAENDAQPAMTVDLAAVTEFEDPVYFTVDSSRLECGVAHDFNNHLTVINGYSEMLMDSLESDDPLRASLSEIHRAGERAAELTQQLLAFSRKQILRPRVFEFNRIVRELQPMLARLMGEDIQLSVTLHDGPSTVQADPNQLQQVIVNLAANARDAMPGGGTLRIATTVAEPAGAAAATHPRVGRCVVLAISDNGVGMDEETSRRVFEPFFTTKAVGKGTGLGLSMTQGIVEQTGGFIEVESAPGRGTTFRIYLPAVQDAPEDRGEQAGSPCPAPGEKRTVLVVEDQAQVRKYVADALAAYGYRVIQAESAAEALELCEREGDAIDLVLTDVVMPNASGRDLADRLAVVRPRLRVMFMSGYIGSTGARDAVPREGAEIIRKPFSPAELAGKVGEVLFSPIGPTGDAASGEEPGMR